MKNMKRTLLTIATLAFLAGTPALVHAADTNTPGSSTNAVVKPYPLDYCLVSGDKLGGMGKPIVTVYKGQEIKFCCASCPADFNKDPAKYMKLLAEAEAKLPKAKK
jgi:YHS domain-containing protein